MQSKHFTISRPDGHAIFTRLWRPDAAPRAAVQIVHGLAEHSARYARLAEALTLQGFAVYAHDHRGHGPNCSAADLGFFAERDGWRKLLDDIDAVAARIGADLPGLPRVFLGHSMGSFLGQTYVAERGALLAAAVLSGTSGPPPAILPIGERIVAFERWRLGPRGKSALVQALLFGEQNKPFRPARTPYDWLSRDPDEVDKYIADPLCGFALTNQLAADLVGALGRLASPQLAALIPKTLPIYVFSGARDPVGAKLQGRKWTPFAGPGAAEVKVYSRLLSSFKNEAAACGVCCCECVGNAFTLFKRRVLSKPKVYR